jgi:putative hydrolase of the HAD superfamily
MTLDDFKVLSFDCYGTLIDWETGMIAALAPLTSRVDRSLERDEILAAHARNESAEQARTPTRLYRDLLTVVYRRLAEDWGVAVSAEECAAYGRSIKDWPAFPDSAEALQYLKQHYRLVILSNVDNASFAASNARLQVEFDAIYTAEEIGSYKPSDRNFEYLLARLEQQGFDRREILHTAESLFHDHAPARRHGLATCRIHRRHAQGGFGATLPPGEIPDYDFSFESMAALAWAHREQSRG